METVQHAAQRHAVNNFSSTAFVEAQKGRYVDIWNVLGRSWSNPILEAAWAVNTIPGTEHGILNLNFEITDAQIDLIMQSLVDMKWFTGMTLFHRQNDYLLRMGAKYQAMVDGAEMIVERLTRDSDPSKRVVFRKGIYGLFGQRPRATADKKGNRVDGSVEQIYSDLTDKVKAHEWVIEQMALMQETDCNEEFKGAFATEFELGILAFIVAVDGDVVVEPYKESDDTISLPGVPLRLYESCVLTMTNGLSVTVLNAPAVIRPYGPPRPTSESTIEFFLKLIGIQDGENITVVTARIHGPRIAGDVARQIAKVRQGVEVRGFSAGVKGDPRRYFNHAIAETVNQLVKSIEELFNSYRSPELGYIDTKQVRQYLNRIHANPTMQMVSQIMMEIMYGLVPVGTPATK